jgi:hypothetical protein
MATAPLSNPPPLADPFPSPPDPVAWEPAHRGHCLRHPTAGLVGGAYSLDGETWQWWARWDPASATVVGLASEAEARDAAVAWLRGRLAVSR